jgi:hypothetical protein
MKTVSSPQILEGFITYTPSPRGAKPTLALAPFCYIPTPQNMGSYLLDSLPFLQFTSIFSQGGTLSISPISSLGKISANISSIGTLFPRIIGSSRDTSIILPQASLFYIVNQFKEEDWQNALGDYIRNTKALIPENAFAGNPGTIIIGLLQGQESSALDFLKLITYLISNNFSEETMVVSKYIYKGIKSPLNTGLLKYLFSINRDITKKLALNLFSLAIGANDFDVVKKIMEWGIKPNVRAYRHFTHGLTTPLKHACRV